MVDSAEKTREARARFAQEQVDLIFVYAATYATSSQVVPALQQAHVPAIVLNLQPTSTLDYETMTTAEWLANCSACCVPEKGDLAIDVSFSHPSNLPFTNHVHDLKSLHCSPRGLKGEKPIPGFVRRLMNRWSCSMRLLRYFTCLSSTLLRRTPS